SRRNQSSGDRKQHVCIRMFLPSTFSETSGRDEHARARELRSWRDLPANPLDGLPGLVPEQPPMEREDCKFYCDPCQKGFFTQERYERHMKDHIWCTFPGCKFTCQKGKEWKMAVHAETLHNRPDAPDLADVGSYLAQRKNRFPTQETVKSKVEELFYKASRGVTLPDERRRWLRQHGVLVRKHPRTEETYIASDALRQATNAAAVKAAERRRDQHQEQQQQQQEQKEQQQGPQNLPEGIARDVYSKEEATAAVQRHTDHDRPKRIIPLGPNGTLTRGQKVQLMRDKYRDAKTVPRFYVCHRCGEKGTHWVDECPTKGDEAFERQIVWGEERREPPRQRQRTEADAETTATAAEVDYVATQGYAARVGDDPTALYNGARLMPHPVACRSDAPGPVDGALEIVEDGGPPAEVSARRHEDVDATGQTPDVTRVLAPVAAAARG
ncbi:zinc finger protein, partial [Trypanosoma grayi]|uniref:zinc finger protein n=1 Tax=Trypanosoma grayi TaxID=71804 RepID=UPI0004F43032